MRIDKDFDAVVLFLTIIDEVKIYDGTSGCQTFIDTGDRAFCQLGFGHNISNLVWVKRFKQSYTNSELNEKVFLYNIYYLVKLGLGFGFGFLQSTSLEISVMVPKSRETYLMSQKQRHAIQDFYI